MSVEFNHLRSTRTILEAVKNALTALTLTIGEETPKAFGTVEICDIKDWAAALQRIVTSEDRVCIILYAGDTFENNRQITLLSSRRTTKIELLISDYNLDGVSAQLGTDSQPGSVGLGDAVLSELTGVILDESAGRDAVSLMPVGCDQITVSEEDKQDSPGRHILSLTFDAVGQWMQVACRSSTMSA